MLTSQFVRCSSCVRKLGTDRLGNDRARGSACPSHRFARLGAHAHACHLRIRQSKGSENLGALQQHSHVARSLTKDSPVCIHRTFAQRHMAWQSVLGAPARHPLGGDWVRVVTLAGQRETQHVHECLSRCRVKQVQALQPGHALHHIRTETARCSTKDCGRVHAQLFGCKSTTRADYALSAVSWAIGGRDRVRAVTGLHGTVIESAMFKGVRT